MTSLTSSQRLLATGLTLGVSLVAFEMTAVITALPTITAELDGDSLYGVALAAYTLADIVALVATGEIADRRGPMMPYLCSLITFTIGLLVAAAAPAMWCVVLGRALQGAGTGGLAPISYVLVKRAFPADRHGSLFALLSAGWVLPSLIAPSFGGAITERFGWQWVFVGIVPLVVVVGVLALIPMRGFGPSDAAPAAGRRSRVPVATVAAVGIGVASLAAQDRRLWIAATVVPVGLVAAVMALRRLLPTGTFRATRGLPAIVACRGIATAAFLGVDSFVPLATDRVHGVSPARQGQVIIGGAIAWSAGQAWRARRPPRSVATASTTGFAILTVGAALSMPVVIDAWPLWAIFMAWSIGGFGMGLLFNPTSVAAMDYASDGQEGHVSSQVHLADALGFSIMGGLGGSLVALSDRSSWPLANALTMCMSIAVLLGVVGVITARRMTPSA